MTIRTRLAIIEQTELNGCTNLHALYSVRRLAFKKLNTETFHIYTLTTCVEWFNPIHLIAKRLYNHKILRKTLYSLLVNVLLQNVILHMK
jgi:hypothetical protein